jgi:hypothetical protein
MFKEGDKVNIIDTLTEKESGIDEEYLEDMRDEEFIITKIYDHNEEDNDYNIELDDDNCFVFSPHWLKLVTTK